MTVPRAPPQFFVPLPSRFSLAVVQTLEGLAHYPSPDERYALETRRQVTPHPMPHVFNDDEGPLKSKQVLPKTVSSEVLQRAGQMCRHIVKINIIQPW